METKYNGQITEVNMSFTLKKIINQVYKLLPLREENGDWQRLLNNIIVQLTGMSNLLPDTERYLFPVLCKLEGLYSLTEEEDFNSYRSTIFSCLGDLGELKRYAGIE